ncbi:MAG: EAL domain-containing protein [Burkholderiaceae bacterium]
MLVTTETPGASLGCDPAVAAAPWPLLRLGADGRCLGVGELWGALTGLATDGDCWAAIHVLDRQRLRDEIAAAIDGATPLRTEVRVRRADSVYRPMTVEVAAVGDEWWLTSVDPLTISGASDTNETQADETQADDAGDADGPAHAGGLPAAIAAFFQRVARQRALDLRHGRVSAFVDIGPIDWASLGTDKGQGLVRRLASLLRRSDLIVAPNDGPTVVLITDLGADMDDGAANAGEIARKIVHWLRPRLPGHGSLAASVTMIGERTDWPVLLEEAEQFRRHAQQAGMDVIFVEAALQRAASERARLVDDLRAAIDAGSFVLQYQPMLGRERRLAGLEALLRWHRRDAGGLHFPGQFLAEAERAGLMQRLGRWVLETACMRHGDWQQRLGRELPLAINISATEFASHGFADHACEVLARSGLASGAIVLELPAQVLSSPDQRSLSVLGRLRSAGFGIVFDGYGERGVDLMTLRELPVDAIKVDSRNLLDHFGPKVGRAVTDAVVGVAHCLGLEVQAKAIETREQFDLFNESGCDAFQGRLLGDPSASPRALSQAGLSVA